MSKSQSGAVWPTPEAYPIRARGLSRLEKALGCRCFGELAMEGIMWRWKWKGESESGEVVVKVER